MKHNTYEDLVSLKNILDIREPKGVDLFKCCAVISQIALFKNYKDITQDDIDKEWKYDEFSPSWDYIRRIIKIPNIKWYIKNHVEISDPIWNGSFIHGLGTVGNIKPKLKSFPDLEWNCNDDILHYIKNCPFSGKIYNIYPFYRWNNVSSFYLKYDVNSLSYLMGVLSTGKKKLKKGKIYACYSKQAARIIENNGIPILHRSKLKEQNLISVFWPALLSPKIYGEKPWEFIYNCDEQAEKYASILWRLYISDYKVDTGKIPYLPSKSTMQRKYGTVKDNQKLWFSSKLTQLDSKIIVEFVRQANMEGEQNECRI